MSLYRSRAAIPVVEGQSTSWLRWAVKVGVDEANDLSGTVEMLRVFKERVDAIGPLAESRNWIIHGTWRRASLSPDSKVNPRPFGNDEEDGTPVLICSKSRLKGNLTQKAFSIGDIERIADEYHALNLQITREWQEIRPPMPDGWLAGSLY
ncbi:hypothetical protein [Actinomycetospora corticicola]|uniref:Uncharacterized protein n=1 Tax=Actinomycetospora corticicola TaxID=663602 RepID=A0A7Y9J6W7_9PSEU|nr:hypothetical protein [Actinomycetospora corticicola]NYD37690.1 hypothetical protein [Actinomycetospora corticicola]